MPPLTPAQLVAWRRINSACLVLAAIGAIAAVIVPVEAAWLILPLVVVLVVFPTIMAFAIRRSNRRSD